jgi:hypothetical protein
MTKGNKRRHQPTEQAVSPQLVYPKKKDNKPTPTKPLAEEIGKRMNEIAQFGNNRWCAAQEQCTNKQKQATDEFVCTRCKMNAHPECINEETNYCLWCKELKELEDEYGEIEDNKPTSLNGSLYSDASSKFTENNIAARNDQEIIFYKEESYKTNDGDIVDFPMDTSAISKDGSFYSDTEDIHNRKDLSSESLMEMEQTPNNTEKSELLDLLQEIKLILQGKKFLKI